MAFEHLQWLSDEHVQWLAGAKYEMVALRAFIAAAKFLWGDEDEEDDTERPYANVPIVRQLRKINKDAGRRARGGVRLGRPGQNGYPGISTSTSCGAWKTSARRGCTTARERGATAPWRGVCSDFSSSVCCRACRTGSGPSGNSGWPDALQGTRGKRRRARKNARAAKVNDDSSDEGLEIVNAERTGWIDLKTSATAGSTSIGG